MRNLRIGAVALAAALVSVGCTQSPVPEEEHPAATSSGDHGGDHGGDQTISRMELRDQMRKLWTDHVAYTRFYIIESIANLPAADTTAARLLHNQDEIGNAIEPFYGAAAGNRLAKLLREHIKGAVVVLNAAKANDSAALTAAVNAWFANADDIAHFLAAANPAWSFTDLQAMMHEHLQQTIDEATARLTGQFDADVRAFDAIVDHILAMADVLADGIAQQFPDKVSGDSADDVHIASRKLWEDHVVWTRVVIIEAIGAPDCTTSLPGLDSAVARLLRNQDDIGNAVRPFVGDAGADKLTALLHDHITQAIQIVAAAKAGDTATVNRVNEQWYDDAEAIAALLADALHLPQDAVEEMMEEHLDLTLTEAVDRLAGRYNPSIEDYDAVVDEILEMSDTISDALAKL